MWQKDVPEAWPQRLCAGSSSEVFFVDSQDGIDRAKAVCVACPVLARCANWAISAGLTDCVVAGVRMPTYGPSRDAAVAALRTVADIDAAGEAA
jgi:hypothetical protein